MATKTRPAPALATETRLEAVSIPRLLTASQVAEILGVHTNTLNDWRTQRRHLEFQKFGTRVMYDAADVANFITRTKQKVSHD